MINKNVKIDRNAPFDVQLRQALEAGYGEPESMSLSTATAILDEIIPATEKERHIAHDVYNAESWQLGDPPDMP